LIAETANTKVMFVSVDIIKQFLTKEEFFSFLLSENNSLRKSDLEVVVENEASAKYGLRKLRQLKNAMGFNKEPLDARLTDMSS